MSKSKLVCINEGCDNHRMLVRAYNTTKVYRPMCSRCYRAARGLTTFAEGVKPVKKDYCENRDARLGYKCKATNLKPFQLDMDHIDGDNTNNEPKNIQTLCKNCHALKSKTENNHARRY
jgi:hypothetical protein